MNPIHLVAGTFTVDAASSDGPPSRSITGLAVPWNVATTDSLGQRVMFKPGSLPEDGRPPKLVEGHDLSKIRGLVTERVSTDQGMMFTARLADTRDAQDTMALLQMGAIDAVSVGVVPTKFAFDKNGTMVVEAANWQELSLVAVPAFEDARIASVTASAPEDEPDENPTPIEPEEDLMSEATPVVVEASAPATIPTEPIWAQPRREFQLPSPAEYIAAYVRGGSDFAQLNENIRRFAAPDVLTTDTPGVLPTPIVQPVYNNFRGLRPVIDAIGAKAMPGGGKVFIRPSVTTHTSMGAQSTENTALQSGTFVVTSNQVTKGTYGGYVTISEQDLDWTDPAVLGLVLDDMARIYANQTDDVAADNLVAGATVTRVLSAANLADPDKWVEWIYGASSTILSSSNGNLPTHLFVDPTMWSNLGKLVDSSKRPLFPQAGPMNAYGEVSAASTAGNAFGLTVVVDRNFAANTLIIGDPSGFEIFEQQKGAISIDVPSTLSRTIAFRGYFATLMIDNTKFVKRVAS